MPTPPRYFIGLMSGTSLDGVDGVLAAFPTDPQQAIETCGHSYVPFSGALRADLMALQQAGHDEIHREALAANVLTQIYHTCVEELLTNTNTPRSAITAIGVHGQTIRHRPELGFTRQTNNPALLAELTGIDVIADFRQRDIAAGGQGAPLVPAFHQAIFGSKTESRAVINIGGFSNISILPANHPEAVTGFDTGPGNILMDAWIQQHCQQDYDANGDWAAQGQVHPALLAHLVDESFFRQTPPKSTGRDSFHLAWLTTKLTAFPAIAAVDVQATLSAFTAQTIAQAVHQYAPATRTAYICGGGAYNAHLMQQISQQLHHLGQQTTLHTTETLGVAPHLVEALAFAWLAERFTARAPSNLPAVTGAKGLRVLGALYPA
jgi:anhydro-N-acetylmuramic acid kinase